MPTTSPARAVKASVALGVMLAVFLVGIVTAGAAVALGTLS